MRSGVMNEDHGQTRAAGMGTAPTGREGSVQEKSTAFPALVGPLRSGVGLWNRGCGIKTALFLRHFCVIKRVALPPGGNGSKKLTVSLPFLDRNGGGVRRTPVNQGLRRGR